MNDGKERVLPLWQSIRAPGLVLKIVLNVSKEEVFFFPYDLLISLKCATLIFLLKEAGLRQDK